MTALAMLAIQTFAPALLSGGTVGFIIAGLRNPLAGHVVKVAKGAARGDHLSEESKRIFAEYKTRYPYNRWHDF